MKELLFDAGYFSPGKVRRNELRLDRSLPLESQLEDLEEDLLLVEFPTGVSVDVGWYPGWQPQGEFGVTLRDVKHNWDPFVEKRCRSIPELQRIIEEFVNIARNHPPAPAAS